MSEQLSREDERQNRRIEILEKKSESNSESLHEHEKGCIERHSQLEKKISEAVTDLKNEFSSGIAGLGNTVADLGNTVADLGTKVAENAAKSDEREKTSQSTRRWIIGLVASAISLFMALVIKDLIG